MKNLFSRHQFGIGFGFATYCLIIFWLCMTGHGSAYAFDQDWLPFPVERYAFFAIQVISLFSFAMADRFVARNYRIFCWAFCLCLMVGSLVFSLGSHQNVLPAQMVATIGCVLMATGFSWCLLNFWHFLKYHLSIKSTGIILIIGIATAYLVYLASETLGSDGERNVLLLIATLLLSLNTVRLNYLIKPEQKEGRDASGQATDDSTAALTTVLTAEEARHTGRAVARIQKYLDSKGVAIFIANISMIPLKGMGALGFWGYRQFDTMETPQGYILMFLGSITLFVMASVPVFYYSTSRLQKANRSGMQMPFLLLIIGTFVAIITQVLGLSTAVSYTVSMVVGLYSQVLFCFATALYIKSTQYSAFRVCGIVYGTSFLIATVWIFLLEDMSQIVKFVILLIAYSTMIYLLKHEPDVIEIVKVVPSPGISADKPHISKNIERLTETFRLTKRESEILRLLAQGRSVPYIEEELTLSNGTVRTHVRHIYEKMNIHNKQELIDMVNSDGYIPFRQF